MDQSIKEQNRSAVLAWLDNKPIEFFCNNKWYPLSEYKEPRWMDVLYRSVVEPTVKWAIIYGDKPGDTFAYFDLYDSLEDAQTAAKKVTTSNWWPTRRNIAITQVEYKKGDNL